MHPPHTRMQPHARRRLTRVAQVAGLAIDLDAVGQELLEGSRLQQLVVDQDRAVDGELEQLLLALALTLLRVALEASHEAARSAVAWHAHSQRHHTPAGAPMATPARTHTASINSNLPEPTL